MYCSRSVGEDADGSNFDRAISYLCLYEALKLPIILLSAYAFI